MMRRTLSQQKQTNIPFNYQGENILDWRKAQFQRRKKLAKGES
jgi:hypothetical protein